MCIIGQLSRIDAYFILKFYRGSVEAQRFPVTYLFNLYFIYI